MTASLQQFFRFVKHSFRTIDTLPMKPTKQSINYVDNKKLHEALLVYKKKYDAGEDINGPEYEYIGKCIWAIAHGLTEFWKFKRYSVSWKEEMIHDGIENAIMYLHNFDPTKYVNPFAYLTTVMYYAFIRRIQKEKKQQAIKIKNMLEHFTLEELDEENALSRQVYRNNLESLAAFETSIEAKKQKTKKLKGLELYIKKDEDEE